MNQILFLRHSNSRHAVKFSHTPIAVPLDTPNIVLDLSRLLSRLLHPTPTGVDRVEMAYAEGLLRLVPARVEFVGCHPSGLYGRLPRRAVEDFIGLTAERWDREGSSETRSSRWRRAAAACIKLTPLIATRRDGPPRAYLHLSACGLERRELLRRAIKFERARFIPFVHDLIPLEHPEYARPTGPAIYASKIETVGALAAGVLCNSNATARAVTAQLLKRGRPVPVRAVPLGTNLHHGASATSGLSGSPYFLLIGTIEPRKNHMLILHLWRKLVTLHGSERTPRLVLVGRRGWENEMILDLLERAPGLKDVVREASRVADTELRSLIRGARAVLMPSFAEGFGLPVVEALALGAPVVASDLPALREAGGRVADYLDPLDGAAWTAAVLDYAKPESPMRRAQLKRMAAWRPPSWDDHLAASLDFVAEVCR